VGTRRGSGEKDKRGENEAEVGGKVKKLRT
jgi:hypothetical protein